MAVAALVLGGCTATDDPEPRRRPAVGARPSRPAPRASATRTSRRTATAGYDVAGYDLKLRYDPKSGELSGSATITATATQDLSRFNLDLAHLTASKVTVDGRWRAARRSATNSW